MGRPSHTHWALHILQPVISLIWDGYQKLEVHIFKTSPTRKTISKVGDGTDAEHMDTRVPKFTWKVKEGHCGRTYIGNTRPILEVLHQYWLAQVCNGISDSSSGWIGEIKKGIVTIKVRWKVWILQVLRRTPTTPNLFQIKSNGITFGKVEPRFCGRSTHSKVVNW